MRHVWALGLGALVAFLAPRAAEAQHDYWELNLHVGGLTYDLDDDGNNDTDVLTGVRLARHWSNGWGFGVNGDWVFADRIPVEGFDDIDVSIILYSAELNYTFPSTGVWNFFVGAGIGAATERLEDIPPNDEDESDTDLLIPLTVGLKIHDRPDRPRVALRIDARDNLIWRNDISFADPGAIEFGESTDLTNNWELSGGISFFFGGGPPPPPPVVDSDGDGVPDDRDQCPNTPLGTPVDSFGCPIPVDSDGDGVPDDRDLCPETPIGTEVDSDGCPIVEEAPAACADGRDWYRFNETISVEGRNWVKFGDATAIPSGELVQIGEYDGVPVYARTDARRPYREIYVPLCAPADTYQPYQVEPGVRGTTG